MNWEAIGAIAEVVGVVAVVGSLIFVGFQVRQNTVQLRHDNLRETIRGTLDTNWYYHRNDAAFDVYRKGCNSFDELSPKEQAHFHSIVVDLMFYFSLVLGMHQAKLIDSDTLEIAQRFVLAVLCTPGGEQWWAFARRTKPMPDAIIIYLQSLLDAPDSDRTPITELQPWFASDG